MTTNPEAGMRLVPVEPTEAEIAAVHAALSGPAPTYSGPTNTLDRANLLARHIASALIAAAPVAPAGEACVDDFFRVGMGFDGPHDQDTPLQAAAREAGWALMQVVDLIPWDKRQHVQNIYGKLATVVDAHPAEPAARDGLTANDIADIIERLATWLEQQAARHEEAGKDERFKTLSDARKADARNYRKMASDARSALKGGGGGG